MASFSFDVFTGDSIRSLLVGRELVLCPLETVVDPQSLFDLMRRESVDAAEFVPADRDHALRLGEQNGERLDFMKLVIVSSEAWRTEQYAFFRGLCGPETRLINAYGLTEATIDSTWYEASPDERARCRAASCRSAGRSRIRPSTSSTGASSRCRSGSRVSSASAASALRRAT